MWVPTEFAIFALVAFALGIATLVALMWIVAKSSLRSRIVGPIFVGLLIVLVLLGLNLALTFASWQLAIAADVLVVVAAAVVWRRKIMETRSRNIIIGSLIVGVVLSAFAFRTTWATHSRHDARLADMVDTLCNADVPDDAKIQDCGGSLSNTGNGNSCRYWARAEVETAEVGNVIDALRAQGFGSTDLNIWDEPIEDSLTYVVPTRDGSLHLSYQESWQPPEGDLRCN